ncbi:TPA: phage tail protein [Klebsiella variicola]
MSKKFSAILTAQGAERLAAAAVKGIPLGITHMAVGDGGGVLPVPSPDQTALMNEQYRAPLNRLVIADQAANVIRAEMIMPPQAGGFWIREAALFDETGTCLAVANLPESYKPLLAEGSGRFQVINIWLMVSQTADVQMIADPSVILATVEEVRRAGNNAKDYADDIVSTLENETREAIASAVSTAIRDFWEAENPVGTVRFYSQHVDPNERYPWSTWTYTGENRTLRVAKADGSNVGTSGGSDTVTLQRANLPAVQIDVSGETSEQPEQRLTTTRGGIHHHGGVAGKDDPWEIGGDVRQLFNPKEPGVTDDAGEHDHEVTVPAHKHTTSGKTANLGEGKSFSVVEAHTLLMCWSRVA